MLVKEFHQYCKSFVVVMGEHFFFYTDYEKGILKNKLGDTKIKEVYDDCGVCVRVGYNKEIIRYVEQTRKKQGENLPIFFFRTYHVRKKFEFFPKIVYN